jgi:hypothetical protein
MRPSQAPAQRQYRVGIDRQNPVEGGPNSLVVSVASRSLTERKAVGDQPGLGVAGRVEALRLDGGVGREPTIGRPETIATFEPPGVALRVEVGGGDGRLSSKDWRPSSYPET